MWKNFLTLVVIVGEQTKYDKAVRIAVSLFEGKNTNQVKPHETEC